jgi:hypothetical protein
VHCTRPSWESGSLQIAAVYLAYSNGLKLVKQRKFHPFDIDMEFAPEMPDKWQGQLIKSATEETDLSRFVWPSAVFLQSSSVARRTRAAGSTPRRNFSPRGVSWTRLLVLTKSCPPTSFSNEFIASEMED